MSTYKSVADVIQQLQYWLRLATFQHGPLLESLRSVLRNKSNDPSYVGLPENPTDLYHEFNNTYLDAIHSLKRQGVLKQEQIDLLIPPGDTKTYSDKFDITLIVVLIRSCTTLAAPLNGWNDKNPPAHDKSYASNVIRAREWRNFVHHCEPSNIDTAQFNAKWAEGEQIVIDLGGNSYDIRKLKTISLDPKHELVLKSLFTLIENQGDTIGRIQLINNEILIQLNLIKKEINELRKLPRQERIRKGLNTY